jgi:hypothetical protein
MPVKQATDNRKDQATAALTSDDQAILDRVERYLADGLALKRWWDAEGTAGRFDQRFELTRTLNRPSESFGFFSQTQVEGSSMPLMGNVQDLFFDQPKVSAAMKSENAAWLQQQLREFVLHYFMRVSSFRQPESVISDEHHSSPSWLSGLSLCSKPEILKEGFGFSQLYYKTLKGEIGKFDDESAIIDSREIGTKYEWIVLKVKILNFSVTANVPGEKGPDLVFGLDEESYLVMTQDFVLDQDKPIPGVAGRYGVGYAFIKSPKPSFLAYGPGEFDAAIELIEFHISENGAIKTRMVFVANRPEKITNVSFDPVDWSLRGLNMLTMGMASSLLGPIRNAAEKLPLQFGNFDPVYSSITLLNTVTGGQAAERLCISKETLDKFFLLQHFKQHYETITGCLLTWRLVGDWLDSAALPEWVVTGKSS